MSRINTIKEPKPFSQQIGATKKLGGNGVIFSRTHCIISEMPVFTTICDPLAKLLGLEGLKV